VFGVIWNVLVFSEGYFLSPDGTPRKRDEWRSERRAYANDEWSSGVSSNSLISF
jgi:hypothetical protein